MQRRTLLGLLLGLPMAPLMPRPAAAARKRATLLQDFPLAGFQFHNGERLWNRLAAGQALTLVREPENRHDQRAVRIERHGQKLGYVPRSDNAAISQLLDRGHRLEARIHRLGSGPSPWDRVRVAVCLAT